VCWEDEEYVNQTRERALSLCVLQRVAVSSAAVRCSVACCSSVLRCDEVCCSWARDSSQAVQIAQDAHNDTGTAALQKRCINKQKTCVVALYATPETNRNILLRSTRDQQKHIPAPRAHPITHRTSERALSLCMSQRAAVPCVAVWCSVACCSRVLRRGAVCCSVLLRCQQRHAPAPRTHPKTHMAHRDLKSSTTRVNRASSNACSLLRMH